MKEFYYHFWIGRYDTEEEFEDYLFPRNGICQFFRELGYPAQEDELFRNNGKMEFAFPYLKALFPIHELLKISPVQKDDLKTIKKMISDLNIVNPNTYIWIVDNKLYYEFGKKFDNYYYLGYFQMDDAFLKQQKISYPQSFE